MYRCRRPSGARQKRVGMGRLRGRMERAGLASSIDPFTSKKESLSIDRSKLPEHAQEYCRRWFKIGLIDFPLWSRDLVYSGRHFHLAGGCLDVSE